MPEFTYDLDPVTRITAHAIGEPGKRVFWIQGRRDRELISLIAEKEQVRALAQAISQLLEDLAEKNPLLSSSDDMLVLASDMSLQEPLESRFRIAQIGIGYDADRDMVILVMQGIEEEGEETPTARFSATRQQMRALGEHAERIVAQGRKICGNCGRPMDLSGHFCPQMN
jgi:uncharacterized repeat protein (TIGR03847 family)